MSASSSAQLVVSNGANIDMNGSTGSTIIFPDGTIQSTAPTPHTTLPAGHGGTGNTVSATNAFVGGGYDNTASGVSAAVGGGLMNTASGYADTVGGGRLNTAGGYYATVAGGYKNSAPGYAGTVAGGTSNSAVGYFAAVGGGRSNVAAGYYGTIGGGLSNTAGGYYGTVAGGADNSAAGPRATVGGGWLNMATGDYATVAGGNQNDATGMSATVAGGTGNLASGYATFVGGGTSNTASGNSAVVPGGYANLAAGDYSFAAGLRARIDASHNGVFLFADGTNGLFPSTSAHEFAVRATGGVRFVTSVDLSMGVVLAGAGGESWTSISARDSKENFEEIDAKGVLEKLAAMDIQKWNYIHQDETRKHIGPVAEDFHAAFGLSGEYTGRISTLDFDGVALAAIQGLNEKHEAQVAHLREVNAKLETRLAAIEQQLAALARQ